MKIGILTLPLYNNYGGVLQAYALQTVLERMGHEVEVLQKIPGKTHPLILMPLVYMKRCLYKLIEKSKYLFGRSNSCVSGKECHLEAFIHDKIKTRRLKGLSEIKEFDYDAIVVGSDQVWRAAYYHKKNQYRMLSVCPAEAFLSFADGWKIKKISYAASFGVDEWEFPLVNGQTYIRLVKQFANLSVREESGVRLCRQYLFRDAIHVLDPTLLLDRMDYIELINQRPLIKATGNLFCYILDSNEMKTELIHKVSSDTGLTPFAISLYGSKDSVQPSVEAWLNAFEEAEYVVTDSFHACVFSIIFNKPFVAIGNAERGMARFKSLLRIFNLENRLICPNDSLECMRHAIDWASVNETLLSWKHKSYKYLYDSLV